MAKAADVKAPKLSSDSYDADDQGWLDKLIAEEDEPERTTLWRLGSWAIVAVVALTLGLMSGQLPDGAKRADVADAELAAQAQQIAGFVRETKQETRRISAAVDTLNSDRDRLFGRLATVEQSLDSVTGSIAKQAASVKPAEPTPDKAVEPAVAAAPAEVAAQPAAPILPATAEEAKPEAKPETRKESLAKDAPKVAIPQTSVAQTESTKKADRKDSQRVAAPAPAMSNMAATSAAPTAQAPPAQEVDLTSTTTVAKQTPSQQDAPAPTTVVTATPLTPLPEEEITAAAASETPVDRTQFGLDLGGASSMAGLRALWSGVRKAHPSQFAALRPVLAIRQGKNGLGLQVHVVAGPIPDAAVAAQLCAILTADERSCETAVFDGQRLLPDLDDAKKKPAAAPAKPARRKQAHREPATAAPSTPTADRSKTSMLSLLGVR